MHESDRALSFLLQLLHLDTQEFLLLCSDPGIALGLPLSVDILINTLQFAFVSTLLLLDAILFFLSKLGTLLFLLYLLLTFWTCLRRPVGARVHLLVAEIADIVETDGAAHLGVVDDGVTLGRTLMFAAIECDATVRK